MRNHLLFALPLFFAAAPANAQNALANSGFESGTLSPWTAITSPSITTAQAHTGLYSVSAFTSDGIRQDFAPIATAGITEASFWVKREGGPFDAYIFYYDDASQGSFLVNGLGNGNDWMFFDVTANLAASKNLTGFSIFGTSPGPAYFDDFTIRTAQTAPGVPEPSTWAAMLLGFGFVGGAMRSARGRRRALAGA